MIWNLSTSRELASKLIKIRSKGNVSRLRSFNSAAEIFGIKLAVDLDHKVHPHL